MEAPVDDLRIVNPFIPPLSDSDLIRAATHLWNEYGFENTIIAFDLIEHGIPAPHVEYREDPIIKISRAHKILLSISAVLRKRVVKAVHGLHFEARIWKQDHYKLKDENCTLYWRVDGSIDRIKTVHQVVLNSNIYIRKRFETACEYCLEESIQTLWEEMKESERSEMHEESVKTMVSFWIKRMRGDSQMPWTRAVVEHLDSIRQFSLHKSVSCSYFFPLLQPADRKRFLSFFEFPRLDDLKLCMYSMTREEQEQILKVHAEKVLFFHFDWPLRSLFLETAEKLWSYMNPFSFCCLLTYIFSQMAPYILRFGTYELVMHLWNMSSNDFKEMARKCSYLSLNIDQCLNELKKKE